MISKFTTTLALVSGILLAAPALAAEPTTYRFSPESIVTYHVSHPLHHSEGVSHQVEGALKVMLGATPQLALPLYISIPLTTFKSGNRNRDRNMLETLNAARFPNATVVIDMVTWKTRRSEGNQTSAEGEGKGQLTLHGITRPITVPLKGTLGTDGLKVESHFSFLLSDFSVDRPSLMFRPIDDQVTIDLVGVTAR